MTDYEITPKDIWEYKKMYGPLPDEQIVEIIKIDCGEK